MVGKDLKKMNLAELEIRESSDKEKRATESTESIQQNQRVPITITAILAKHLQNVIETVEKKGDRFLLWGFIRFFLGIFLSFIIWFFILERGLVIKGTFLAFALSIAISLSGLIVLLTQKSFSELATAWSNTSAFNKLLITISISAFLYVGLLVLGSFLFD